MTDNSKETGLPGRSSEGKSIANAPPKRTYVIYIHILLLSAIIFASLLAAWSGSRGIFRGGLALEPADDHVAPMSLTTIEGAICPMEVMVASLAPLTPEVPPPVAAAFVEIETPEDPASQPPPDHQPTPEPPPAVTPAATAVMETTPAPLGPSPVPQNDTGEGSAMPPPEPSPVESQPEPTSTAAPIDVPAVPVTAIGDSVMLGAASTLALAIADIEVDAEVSRQASTAVDILRTRRDAGQLGEVVVVHIGNNGTFSASQFDQMMEALANVRRVVFVNLKVPRDWEGPNNSVLAEGVSRYRNTVLVDWRAASVDRPEFFWDDGIHLRPEGVQVYAQLIAASVRAP